MNMRLALLFIAASLLIGCEDNTPKCNSDDAKGLVVNITYKHIKKKLGRLKNSQMEGMIPANTDSLRLRVINIRILDGNPPNTTEIPIT